MSYILDLIALAVIALLVHLRTHRKRRMEGPAPYPKQARGPIAT